MKRKATDLLQSIPEIQILNISTDSDADDINESERKTIHVASGNSTSIPLDLNENSIIVDAKTVDDDSSAMLIDNDTSTPQLQQMEEDPTYDSCNLTKKWKQITSKERAMHAVYLFLL
jgi:hypothetical protein